MSLSQIPKKSPHVPKGPSATPVAVPRHRGSGAEVFANGAIVSIWPLGPERVERNRVWAIPLERKSFLLSLGEGSPFFFGSLVGGGEAGFSFVFNGPLNLLDNSVDVAF